MTVGAFRSKSSKWGVLPEKIHKELTKLLQNYEKWSANYEFSPVNYEEGTEALVKILDLHVGFENICPFADYNGRVGRILILKECLRFGIDLFIIDDKHRSAYNRGITSWNTDLSILQNVALEAQSRFQNKLETCDLMQYHRPPK